MPPPRITVCIDVYNYADYLPRAIESVLDQTFSDFELVVLDDCSTDFSHEIAEKYARSEPRIRFYRNRTNLGMVKNRNACLRYATGEYVKFLHADDFLCSPDALGIMLGRIEANPGASMVACPMQFVRENGSPEGRSPGYFTTDRFHAGTSVITRCLREQKNLIGGPSAVLVRRDRAARSFDESLFHAADLEMWLHLLEQGCFGYIDSPLVAYRWHSRQQTEKDRASLSQFDDLGAILSRYLDKPYVRIRPWLKRYLRHEAIRQTLRRCRKLRLAGAAREALERHGERRYYLDSPWCLLWREAERAGFTGSERESARPAASSTPGVPGRPEGINVAGFLRGQYGIGESSRAFCRAVAATGLPHVSINIDSKDHANADTTVLQLSEANPYGINVMAFSFDYARRFYRDRGKRFFAERRNIAIWYWELQEFPPQWHFAFEYYDEIWAPSEFCRQALAAVSPVPVRRITYPFYLDTAGSIDIALLELLAKPLRSSRLALSAEAGSSEPELRADLGSEATAPSGSQKDPYLFLFNFDFYSTLARKNPLAVVAAFRMAFAPGDNVTLVLKSINSQHDPPGREQLAQAIGGLNVVWIESHLSDSQMRSLFAICDCYVSLHRSEGLGLGMAQAMALGKPVIATGYSGNLEYMHAGNSILVKYSLTELSEDCGAYNRPPAYHKGFVWAEPDIADAASKMRWAFEHREEAARIGQRAQADIRACLDPDKTRAEIAERVREVYRG